jgi:hypothetical protein
VGLHLRAEPRDHGHGGVEGVAVHEAAVGADEGQDAAQASRLEHRPGLPGADLKNGAALGAASPGGSEGASKTHQFQHFDALLGQVLGGPVGHVGHDEPVAHRLDGAVHRDDAPGALGRHVQVVGDGPGGDLQHEIRGLLVDEDSAEGREERPRRAALEAAVHVVRHEEQHAELLQGDQLHVALVSLNGQTGNGKPNEGTPRTTLSVTATHLSYLEPLQEGLGVDLGHGCCSVAGRLLGGSEPAKWTEFLQRPNSGARRSNFVLVPY